MDETEAVTTSLAELLRHPDDLEKIPALKADFTRKKAHVDSELKTGLETQLQVTSAGISALSDGQAVLNSIKEEMMRIDRLCADSENMIAEFPLINKISKIHRNFMAVIEVKDKLQSLDSRLADIRRMHEEDTGDELTNPMPNLLATHHAITQLQDFREEVMEQSQRADAADRETLERYFEPLDTAVEQFDERIGLISMCLIDLVKAGNRSLVVRLAKIIDAEERADERVLAVREAQDTHHDLAAKFQSINKGPKVVRGYKEKFMACIKAAAETKMENPKNNFQDDPDSLEDSMQWYFDDLEVVKLEFPSLMPPRWNVFGTFLEMYHGLLHDFLIEQINKEDLDGQSLLNIIRFVGEYPKHMKRLGVKASKLTPHIIDGKEADLLREYSQLIVKKMSEWMANIATDDTREFLQRTNQPNEEDGKWHMPSVPTMFTMINQQLNVALDSNKGSVVADVAEECVRLLRQRQAKWEQVISDEVSSYNAAVTKEEIDSIPDGIIEYLMAVANDQIRSAAYTEEIMERVAPLTSTAISERIRASLDDAVGGFVDLATACLNQLIDIIFNDTQPPIKALFTTAWYGGNDMDKIVSTIRSYVVDLEPGLDESLFPVLMHSLSERTCAAYLGAVRNKGAKFRLAPASDQIRADVSVAYAFLSEYIDRADVKAVWVTLEHFLQLMTAPKEEIGDTFDQFKEAYWDLPMTWVEVVLKCREDKTKDLLEIIRARNTYTTRGGEPTIMSRLA